MVEHRSPKPEVVGSSPSAPATLLLFIGFKMLSPVEFIQQVKREVSKVSWPTRKEVTVTTIMVFILVLIAAGFFLAVDQVLVRFIRAILGLGA